MTKQARAAVQASDEIPLFPVHAVLFPGGVLPLRIFERRYLEMIGECLRSGSGFGICAIESGGEVGRAARCFPVGTLARVLDFDRGRDGLLHVVASGERRFRVLAQRVAANQLVRAQVLWLDEHASVPLPPERRAVAHLLRQLLERVGGPFSALAPNFNDASWVVNRLIELLPFALADKQRLLEVDAPLQRLETLYTQLLAEELTVSRERDG
jgi:Lon protease-like protein